MNQISFATLANWELIFLVTAFIFLTVLILLIVKIKFLKKEIIVQSKLESKTQNELEKKYEFIIANAKDGIYISDYNGAFSYVNDSMKNLLGYESSELVGKHFTDVIHEEDKDVVSSFYKNQLKNRIEDTYLEFRIIEKGGRCKWVAQNVKAITSQNNENKVFEFHSMVRDITTRRVYEMELDRLSLVARKTKNIIFFLDSEYRISWVNDEFTKIFGYNPNEVIGKNPGTLLNGPKTDIKIIDEIELQLKIKKGIKAEILNYTKEGKEIWVEITLDPYFSSEGEIGYIAVEQEVTIKKMQQNLIISQNREIMDSISYSRRIQESTLTSIKVRKEILPNSIVFYEPKEIVSGDFYLVDILNFKETQNCPVFVVADCTGHGVPGAMLSLMCSGILKQAFSEQNLKSTSDILNFTRDKVADILNSGETNQIYDGMDLAVCILNKEKNILQFSGANRPIWLIRNGELTEFKGDRQHVGYTKNKVPFTEVDINVEKGDCFYIFSDGIIDQFGGEKNKRFMSKNLRKLLLKISSLEMDQQSEIITQTINNWKGSNHQTDDICLLGVKI